MPFSSNPSTPSTGGKSILLADLESGEHKATKISINSMEESPSERPVLGRRRTTHSAPESDANIAALVEEEDALTKVGNFIWKIHSANVFTRYTLYIFPVAALLAVPLALTATIYSHAEAKGVRLLGIFVWLEVIWISLWICKLLAQVVPFIFQAACGLISTGVRKYSLVLAALEVPISLLFWAIVAFATSDVICAFGGNCKVGWPSTLSTVFKAGIIVAAIFLAEKTLIQIISINYHRKQYDEKIKESKKLVRLLDLLYDASRALFPEYCREFLAEDADIQGNTLHEVREAMQKAGVGTKIFNDMGRARNKVTAAFGVMASDIAGKEMFSTTSAHSVVIEAIETERGSKALARRLWLSFVGDSRDVLLKSDLLEVLGASRASEAEIIFAALDRDGNGDVSMEEMTMLVVGLGEDRKNRATSMQDISHAIGVLDNILGFIVLIAIALIYATFFSAAFASRATQLWTTFTGLAFAIGGTVTEFLACIIFLFVKHPYDVGDRVDIKDVPLVVERISLMYSVFRRIDSDKTVQIPHNIANTLWIENVSRSKPMKEQYNFSISAATTNEDILALRAQLEKFVQAPENKRDFQDDLDIELISLGDLKQLDLRVEIRHKVSTTSNSKPRTIQTLTTHPHSPTSPTNTSAKYAATNSCASSCASCAASPSTRPAATTPPSGPPTTQPIASRSPTPRPPLSATPAKKTSRAHASFPPKLLTLPWPCPRAVSAALGRLMLPRLLLALLDGGDRGRVMGCGLARIRCGIRASRGGR
jgi:small-conductance mechanosensitive channel